MYQPRPEQASPDRKPQAAEQRTKNCGASHPEQKREGCTKSGARTRDKAEGGTCKATCQQTRQERKAWGRKGEGPVSDAGRERKWHSGGGQQQQQQQDRTGRAHQSKPRADGDMSGIGSSRGKSADEASERKRCTEHPRRGSSGNCIKEEPATRPAAAWPEVRSQESF